MENLIYYYFAFSYLIMIGYANAILKDIAETYYLYREIYHQLTLEAAKGSDMSWNVYLGETLTCSESGEPIKVERID